MDVLVNVVNQKLKIETNLRCIVAGTQQFIRFIFNLPDEWKELMPFVQFSQNGTGYNVYLDNEDWGCYLPSEIVCGTCTMMLYGSNGTVIGTTNIIEFTINENNLIVDAESTDITQSLYDQLVAMIGSVGVITTGQIDALFS